MKALQNLTQGCHHGMVIEYQQSSRTLEYYLSMDTSDLYWSILLKEVLLDTHTQAYYWSVT